MLLLFFSDQWPFSIVLLPTERTYIVPAEDRIVIVKTSGQAVYT